MSPQEMQEQLLEKKATEFTQQSLTQQMGNLAYRAGSSAGTGLAGAFGVDIQDPMIKRATKLRELAGQFNTNTADGLRQMANALQASDPEMALQISQKASAMDLEGAKITSETALGKQREREKLAADPFQKLLVAGKYTPASMALYKESENPKDLELIDKIETKSDFERILKDLNLPPEQEKQVKLDWVRAKVNPDPTGSKAIANQMALLQMNQISENMSAKKDKLSGEKAKAIDSLSTSESSIDTALTTAEQALKLAPGSFAAAAGQSAGSMIPWSDAKALKNLVSSLNSEKALQTLESLKSQSRTGATGFGALSEKELQIILDKTRSLDPTDKMFKENLTVIVEGWKKLKTQMRGSRETLQGKKGQDDPLGLR
jgi:hypothetical protein